MALHGAYDYNRVPGDENDRGGGGRMAPGGVWPRATTPNSTSSAAMRQPLNAAAPDSPGVAADGEESPGSVIGEALKRVQQRHTTDVCGCCIFMWFWIGMVGITFVSIRMGNPRRLFHGFDYHGRLCGVDGPVATKPLIYWPRPDLPKYPVCIEACPTNDNQKLKMPVELAVSMMGTDGGMVTTITAKEETVETYPSKQVGGHYCLPIPTSDRATDFTNALVHEQAESTVAMLRSWIWDIANSWPILALSSLASTLAGYGYLFLLRHGARALTWGLLGFLVLVSAGVAAYCLAFVGNHEDRADALFGKLSGQPIGLVRVVGVSSAALAVMLLAFVSYVYSSMKRAVGCIEASCEAIWAQRPLLRLPVIEVVAKALFTVLWLGLFAYVATSGRVEAPFLDVNGTYVTTKLQHFATSPQQKFNIAYYIVGYIWGIEMCTALFQFAMAYCAVSWYFSPSQDGSGKCPVDTALWKRGFKAGIRYHLGSLALSAAISGIFRPVAGLMAFIAKHAHGADNQASRTIGSTCMCCVWCFDEIIRYVNKNAIIQLVLQSTDFFTSAGAARRLLAAGGADVVPVAGVTAAFQYIGMLAISCFAAGLTFVVSGSVNAFASPTSQIFIENRLIVALTAAFLASAVASAFMSLFDVVSDSLLFCWLTECEDGTTEFAPQSLRTMLGDPAKPESAGEAGTRSRLVGFAAGAAAAAASAVDSAARATAGAGAAALAAGFGRHHSDISVNTLEDMPQRSALEREKRELLQRIAELEAARRTVEEDAARRIASAEVARKAAEELAACIAAEQEAARKAADKAAKEAAAKAAKEAADRALSESLSAAAPAAEIVAEVVTKVEAPTATKFADAAAVAAPAGAEDGQEQTEAMEKLAAKLQALAAPDFRSAPPECWAAIHARFGAKASIQTDAGAASPPAADDAPAAPDAAAPAAAAAAAAPPPGAPAPPPSPAPSPPDFRQAPPELWAALHARFLTTPDSGAGG